MKNLYKYLLNESLLDDELEDRVEDIAISDMLNKNNRLLFDGALFLHNIKYRHNSTPEPHTYSNGKVTLYDISTLYFFVSSICSRVFVILSSLT